jgi:hypothetical protein
MHKLWAMENHETPDFALVHLCGAHLFHTLSLDLTKLKFNAGSKKNLQRIFAVLCLVRTKSTYLTLIELIVTLLLLPKKSDSYTSAMNALQFTCNI